MSFKTVEVVLASAVATGGTFTIPYPDNRDAGFYRGAVGHKIVTETNDVYDSPADFTLSFGTSSITATTVTARTFAADTRLYCQLEERGDNERRADGGLDTLLKNYRATLLSHVRLNLGAPDVADANGYVESQDLTSAGVFSVNTTAAAAIAAAALAGEADVPRNVVAAWTGNAQLTITGYDEYGNLMVEKSAASTTALTGKKAFKRVTGIASSANITALTVGTGDVLGLPIFVGSIRDVVQEERSGVILPRYQSNVILMDHILEAAVDGATGFNFVSPVAGVVKKVWTIAQGGITTGGTATAEINTVAINGLGVVIANSAAEGDVDSDEPTRDHASTVVAAGDRIEVQFPTPFASSADIFIAIEIEPTVTTHGTFAFGDTAAPSATTGDVRGTYDPASACDGTYEFSIVVAVEDPKYIGLDQYAG